MRAFIRGFVVMLAASLALFVAHAAAQADGTNIRTIAGILAKLNHFPNDAEKTALQAIVSSSSATAHEKTLAQALVNVQHTPAAADKPRLEALAKDATAPAAVRTLADVLARLNHTPSAADKEQLTKLAAAP